MFVAGVLDVDGTLAARWSLCFEDLALLNAKPVGTRLGFAAHVWTTPAWQRLFGEVSSVGSVLTCVRPTSAVRVGTAGLDGIRRSRFLHSFTRSSGAVQISD